MSTNNLPVRELSLFPGHEIMTIEPDAAGGGRIFMCSKLHPINAKLPTEYALYSLSWTGQVLALIRVNVSEEG